jgi:hypothetical protein
MWRGWFHVLFVMAGLDPAIHGFSYGNKDVDTRHKAGHDASMDRRRHPAASCNAARKIDQFSLKFFAS